MIFFDDIFLLCDIFCVIKKDGPLVWSILFLLFEFLILGFYILAV